MTRAEFFGKIFNMLRPEDGLTLIDYPIACHYAKKCTEPSCDQCKADMSYWTSEFMEEDTDIITPEKYKELYDKYIGSKIKEDILKCENTQIIQE